MEAEGLELAKDYVLFIFVNEKLGAILFDDVSVSHETQVVSFARLLDVMSGDHDGRALLTRQIHQIVPNLFPQYRIHS